MTRKSLVLSDEIARGNSHRIYVDVHGKLCRLLDEAQSVAISRQNGKSERFLLYKHVLMNLKKGENSLQGSRDC